MKEKHENAALRCPFVVEEFKKIGDHLRADFVDKLHLRNCIPDQVKNRVKVIKKTKVFLMNN